MAAPTPINFFNWNNFYLDVLTTLQDKPEQAQFFEDVIETTSQLLVEINKLEARIAALEP